MTLNRLYNGYQNTFNDVMRTLKLDMYNHWLYISSF